MPNRKRPRAVTPTVTIENTYTESAWARVVEGLLDFYGWRWHHSPDNRPNARGAKQRVGDRGFPDYIAVRNLRECGPELALLELKTETGRLGPGQADWLEALEELARAVAGVEAQAGPGYDRPRPRIIVGVYRPSQRRELEDLLAGPRGRDVYIGRDDRQR